MPDEVVTTPFGKFYVDPTDLIGSTLKAGTCWDGPQFLQVIARRWGRLDDPRSVILDVGANQGAWTMWLASQGQAQIIAVEPVPQTVQRLQANLDLNQRIAADRVLVLPVVAGAYASHATLALYDPHNTGASMFVDNPEGPFDVVPLDDYCWLWDPMRTQVTIVKIDTQGWDWAVLAGLSATLERHRPVVVLEDERNPQAAEEAFDRWREAHPIKVPYQFVKWPSRANDYLLIPW